MNLIIITVAKQFLYVFLSVFLTVSLFLDDLSFICMPFLGYVELLLPVKHPSTTGVLSESYAWNNCLKSWYPDSFYLF